MSDRRSKMRGMVGARAAVILILASLSVSLSQAEDQAPVTLSRAIATVLAQGPDALLNASSLSAARQQYAQALANNKVSLDLSASAGHQSGQLGSGVPAGMTTNGSDSLQTGLAATVPGGKVNLSASHQISEQTSPLEQSTSIGLSGNYTLWDGYGFGPLGKPAASVRQAELSLQGKQLSSRSGLQSIVVNVTQAWFGALQAQATASLREQSLAQVKEELARVNAQYASGLASQLDVAKAQYDEQSAEADLAQARDDLASAKRKLSGLLGWAPDQSYTLAPAPEPQVPELDVAKLVPIALANRADLAQIALNNQAGQVSLALTRAQASPTVGVSGGLSFGYNWTDATETHSWNVGVQASWQLFDSGSLAAQVRQAELSLDANRIQGEQLRQTITIAVADAVDNVKELVARYQLAQKSLELATQQEQVARTNLDQGVGSQLDVLSAVTRTAGARASLEQAKGSLQIGILSLQSTLGTVEVPAASSQ